MAPVRAATRLASGAWKGLVDLLLPACCFGCRAGDISADGLCARCSVDLLKLVALRYCPRCGASLGPGLRESDEDGCYLCPAPQVRFDRVVRIGPYKPPLRWVVQQFKYRRVEAMLPRLADLLSQAVRARLGDRPELVLAVPMHWRRRLWRGYDHASLLARALARRLDLPLGDELIRLRHTPAQVGLPRTRRLENVRGAFGLRRGGDLSGARILLVDDVTTSGATASEAARTLLDAGALSVDLAVLAKAEPPRPFSDAST